MRPCACVYLAAFVSRLAHTWARRTRSPYSVTGSAGRSSTSSWPAASISGRAVSTASSMTLASCNVSWRNCTRPLAVRETSSRSSSRRAICATWRSITAPPRSTAVVCRREFAQHPRGIQDRRERVAQLVCQRGDEHVLLAAGLAQGLLALARVGDVLEHRIHLGRPGAAGPPNRHRIDADPAPLRQLRVPHAHHDTTHRLAGAQRGHRGVFVARERAAVFADRVVFLAHRIAAEKLLAALAEDARGRRVHRDDAAVGGLVHHALQHRLGEQAMALLAAAQRLLGAALFGHVEHQRQQRFGGAVGAGDARVVPGAVDDSLVFRQVPVRRDHVLHLPGEQRRHGVLHFGEVVGVDQVELAQRLAQHLGRAPPEHAFGLAGPAGDAAAGIALDHRHRCVVDLAAQLALVLDQRQLGPLARADLRGHAQHLRGAPVGPAPEHRIARLEPAPAPAVVLQAVFVERVRAVGERGHACQVRTHTRQILGVHEARQQVGAERPHLRCRIPEHALDHAADEHRVLGVEVVEVDDARQGIDGPRVEILARRRCTPRLRTLVVHAVPSKASVASRSPRPV